MDISELRVIAKNCGIQDVMCFSTEKNWFVRFNKLAAKKYAT